jgi:hypothetical protein
MAYVSKMVRWLTLNIKSNFSLKQRIGKINHRGGRQLVVNRIDGTSLPYAVMKN